MHLITFGVIFILVQPSTRFRIDYLDSASDSYSYGVFGTPLPQDPSTIINPFIRHWEPARYDRDHLDRSRQSHENFRRRKRDTNSQSDDYGIAHTVRLKFYAHDKQFNVVLKEDPASVFSPEVEIENTLGPVVYDVSRVYTGTLEGGENVRGWNEAPRRIVESEDVFTTVFENNTVLIRDDESASVHGILTTDNLFDGTITTNLEHYYIEPASKYSKDLHGSGVHSIVYKASDVDQPVTHRNGRENRNEHIDVGDKFVHHCASERLNRNLKVVMEKERKLADKESSRKGDGKTIRKRRFLPDELADTQNPPLPLDLDVPYNDDFNVYSPKHDDDTDSEDMTFPNSKNHLNRKNILINDFNPNTDFNMRDTHRNRNIIINNFDTANSSRPSHKTHVEIITKNGAAKKPNIIVNNYNPDVILTSTNFHQNTIHQHVRNDIIDATSKSSYDRKITCMLYLQADHTFFQKMGSDEASIEAITRHVQRANFIYKNTDFNGDGKPDNITFMIKRIKVHNANALKDPSYRFPGNYGVEKFLELFSEEDYDAFCLAYMFTYRDFEMGTLGLAWTGDLKNAGGVCEKNGHYRGSLKSLNTGIVTLLNYGKHVPPAVSHVTLAHEIGHNFGSPHDPEQCTPGGEDGNYIMFARATSGDKRNNNKFSPCSLKAIEPVLNAKARSAKGCFTEPQQAICGNGVVDPGEQCDCGWEEDCKDKCCYPMSRHPKLDEKPCTLTPRAKCSPSQGPCCTNECALKFGDKCRDDNGCRDPSYCDGNAPMCPPSINKANKTICNKEFVCYMGECTGSICLAYGLESCQCIPGPSDPKTKACELCCKLPGEESPCKSSFEWNEVPFDVPDMFAKPGTPCNDYNGYCDVFQKCREVDPSGPLATLRKLLLSEESIASFKKWMQSNWYTVALVVVAVIVLLTLSTKLLGKGSSLKQKSVTIIHSATTETVRLPDDNNGVIVHTAIRTKVPFKKKVRGERSNKIKTKPSTSKTTATKSEPKLQPNQVPAASAVTSSKVFKRQSSNVTATGDSPKKVTKKKKRVSAPVVDEDQNKALTEPAPIKTKKLKKTKSKHKEIIDYSKRSENHSNTFGKVHKWLLESPIASQPLAEVEHTSKVRNIMSKSQSTPERLAPRSPKKVKSLGNLNDKVKLQVVYKPPFKFSLKLSKNSAVKTKVIGAVGRNKRKVRADKHRDIATVGAADAPKSSRRTALLIRSTVDADESQSPSTSTPKTKQNGEDVTESTYETLNTNGNDNKTAPVYENVMVGATGRSSDGNVEPINSATFRISKSVSGSNLNKPQVVSPNSNSTKPNKRSNQIANSSKEFRSSSTNLLASGASSSQNLIRSSTTNLAKNNRSSFDMKRGAYDLSRSSTTNLSKEHRHGSQLNLLKHRGGGSSSNLTFDDILPQSRSRRNSTNLKATDSSSKTNIPRIPSNSNLKLPSLHRGSSINNIPRASLNIHSKIAGSPYQGQFSAKPNGSRADRPHTTDCSEAKRFEWPDGFVADKLTKIDVPSDMEVMVSDVENLVNDT